MITNSYNEWQTSPVSTTITTHPISELKFPTVTVCPPRGTNTALNFVLEKMKRENFTGGKRQELRKVARKVFLEIPAKTYASQMMKGMSIETMKSILDGNTGFPEVSEDNQVTLESRETQGKFQTPGFGDPNYKGDFYSTNRSFNLVLEVQSDFLDTKDIVISVQTEGNWSYRFGPSGYQVYDHQLSMPEAEKFCVSQGGHLPSVTSKEENSEIKKAVKKDYVWLGAKRFGQSGKMSWLDMRPWVYEDWAKYTPFTAEPTKLVGEDCVRFCKGFRSCSTKATRGTWYDDPCDLELRPVCLIPPTAPSVKLPTVASGNKTLLMKKHPDSTRASLQFWWSHEPNMDGTGRTVGFNIRWWAQSKKRTENELPRLSIQENQKHDLKDPGLQKETQSNSKQKRMVQQEEPSRKPQNVKWAMVNLAQTSRVQNKTDQLRNEVLKQRWSSEILATEPCLDDRKAKFVINHTREELTLDYKKYEEISEEDITLGVELFSYIHSCEKKMVEAAKLSVFFEKLLTDHTLETIVASTMNNMQPRVGDKLDDLTAMNMWFEHLDKKLNFSLGPLLIGLSSTSQLKRLKELNPPFLRKYANFTKECMEENKCDDILQVTGEITTRK